MLDHIFHVLESLGITSQKRALHIQFSNQYLNSQVFLQRIDGEHRINDGLIAELLCLSTNVMIPLKQFITCNKCRSDSLVSHVWWDLHFLQHNLFERCNHT